jgi:cell division initiation protein
MRLTPLDIREQQFRRVMRGLDPEEVEAFLANVATEFEQLVAGNNELRQRVVELEERIGEYRSMEKALRDTLLTAEKVMGEAKESAQREAALIIREAEVSVQRSKGRLQQDLAQLQNDLGELRRVKDAYLTRVRWLLRSQLEMLDGHAQEFAEIDANFQLVTPVEQPPPVPPAGPRAQAQAPPRPGGAPRPAQPTPSTAPPTAPGEPPAGWGIADWREPGTPASGLADAMRPVSADGSYDVGRDAPPSGPDAIAQAARRAERLAAEARAARERQGPGGGGWGLDRSRDDTR